MFEQQENSTSAVNAIAFLDSLKSKYKF
jgi:hypothetical protein